MGQNAPLYAQISKGNCIIHLSEHYGDASPGTTLRVEIENLTQYQNLLSAKQFKHARPGINEMPWGLEMPISDPFGNKLIFTQTS
ncbi:hypothetical protein PLUTE_a3694 [Pseudoalteromonas luteoviolacea DSM 6061]|nr:hypothetical protein [Pseudoalteromonas luteoviolacea DSM 6061]